jgi:hypothetical protein
VPQNGYGSNEFNPWHGGVEKPLLRKEHEAKITIIIDMMDILYNTYTVINVL